MCVHPWRVRGHTLRQQTVPCGICIECRKRQARDWAVRCVHEAQMHEENCFVTLTYSDEFLPAGGSLDRTAFPKFMKRLRKRYGKVRYYHAGEYGEVGGRPHYHALLFGLRFSDAVEFARGGAGARQSSEELSALWPYGYSEVGGVSLESAAYVCRYVMKKTNKLSRSYREEMVRRGLEPEYATMSRRPGIGAGWLARYRDEVWDHDSVMVAGREVVPPRYYSEKERGLDAARMEVVKARRLRKYGEKCSDDTWRKRAARELIAVKQLELAEAKRES